MPRLLTPCGVCCAVLPHSTLLCCCRAQCHPPRPPSAATHRQALPLWLLLPVLVTHLLIVQLHILAKGTPATQVGADGGRTGGKGTREDARAQHSRKAHMQEVRKDRHTDWRMWQLLHVCASTCTSSSEGHPTKDQKQKHRQPHTCWCVACCHRRVGARCRGV
jgi:hypothetical protein